MRVRPVERAHLPQLLELVNVHLAAETLEQDHTECVTDPLVEEHATLCTVEGHRVLVVHLLCYGTGPG